MLKRIIAIIVIFSFISSYYQPVNAQGFNVNELPTPGKMVDVSAPFVPLALKGLVINPKKPLEFQFIVDTGSSGVIASVAKQSQQEQLKQQANRLVKYFLAGLTIPEGELWVNLSPYEKNRMIPTALGQTELGRDLLAQDYILKQLTASLIYPEKDLGKEFWSRVYAKAQKQFGTTNIPVNTFNKVWILPDQSQVFENGPAAYVTKATFKVMLDEDYLSLNKHGGDIKPPLFYKEGARGSSKDINKLGSQIIRQIILPEITKEVNTGKNFAPLRQIYQALILAKWYKETIQNALLDAVYTNKKKITGVNLNDPAIKEKIYNRYLQAYKKGVFNYIKEESIMSSPNVSVGDPAQTVPRKYFSGGIPMKIDLKKDGAMSAIKPDGALLTLTIDLKKPAPREKNAAMMTGTFFQGFFNAGNVKSVPANTLEYVELTGIDEASKRAFCSLLGSRPEEKEKYISIMALGQTVLIGRLIKNNKGLLLSYVSFVKSREMHDEALDYLKKKFKKAFQTVQLLHEGIKINITPQGNRNYSVSLISAQEESLHIKKMNVNSMTMEQAVQIMANLHNELRFVQDQIAQSRSQQDFADLFKRLQIISKALVMEGASYPDKTLIKIGINGLWKAIAQKSAGVKRRAARDDSAMIASTDLLKFAPLDSLRGAGANINKPLTALEAAEAVRFIYRLAKLSRIEKKDDQFFWVIRPDVLTGLNDEEKRIIYQELIFSWQMEETNVPGRFLIGDFRNEDFRLRLKAYSENGLVNVVKQALFNQLSKAPQAYNSQLINVDHLHSGMKIAIVFLSDNKSLPEDQKLQIKSGRLESVQRNTDGYDYKFNFSDGRTLGLNQKPVIYVDAAMTMNVLANKDVGALMDRLLTKPLSLNEQSLSIITPELEEWIAKRREEKKQIIQFPSLAGREIDDYLNNLGAKRVNVLDGETGLEIKIGKEPIKLSDRYQFAVAIEYKDRSYNFVVYNAEPSKHNIAVFLGRIMLGQKPNIPGNMTMRYEARTGEEILAMFKSNQLKNPVRIELPDPKLMKKLNLKAEGVVLIAFDNVPDKATFLKVTQISLKDKYGLNEIRINNTLRYYQIFGGIRPTNVFFDAHANPAMTGVEKIRNGGIDLNQIKVNRTGKTISVQFDPAQLAELMQDGFEGFTPVITGFQYIKSPFTLLGVTV